MRKKLFLIFAAITVALCILAVAASCRKYEGYSGADFVSDAKSSFSEKYYELKESGNISSTWRHGMVSGNSEQGVITSGAPYNDTLIYQNIHFVLPNDNPRTSPYTADQLDNVRQSIVQGRDITDTQSYDDVYMFHAGATMRIRQEERQTESYMRYTDYDTAQVGVRYTDSKGEWNRVTFTSRADNATITQITSSSKGKPLNLTLSYDNISAMANFGKGDETQLQYKKGIDGNWMTFVAHYPSYANSELKNGGYATVSYIICEDGKTGTQEMSMPSEQQYVGGSNPAFTVKNASAVYIITVSDRTYDMGDISSFAAENNYALLDDLKARTENIAAKYTVDSVFDYKAALDAHLEIYSPQFDAVTLSLGADTSISNDALLRNRMLEKNLNSTLSERAYYASRYAALCCWGTSTGRLYGMWTGEWNLGWGGKYTMDANVNLQVSSLNTGNIYSAPTGYANFILRQADDWEDNAYATHGYTEAIQAPVNFDGDKAIMTESCYPYPFRYWNAGASWLLQPLYETWQCYGNIQIPISSEFDLYDLRSVLSVSDEDLTDAQINALYQRGYLYLAQDILLPLLTKSANYWKQLMVPQYYTDAAGNICYDADKTSLADDEKYCIIPSYSPENNPANYPSPACANSAIDIAACRSNLEMLMDIAASVSPSADMSEWAELADKIPSYLYDESGVLKEWATINFEENNTHRHLSHLYCVWPLNETRHNEGLRNAAIQAIKNRASENDASHALVHRTLIAARLGDRAAVTESLTSLTTRSIYYSSLMTNHDIDGGSCYCTDFAIGYSGMVNESLVYSAPGEVQLLPALPYSGFNEGVLTGIMLRTRAKITQLSWSLSKGTVSVTVVSDTDQTIVFSCPLASGEKSVTFAKGESKTVEFAIHS